MMIPDFNAHNHLNAADPTLICSLLQSLNAANRQWALLGDTSIIPHAIYSDLDFCTDAAQLTQTGVAIREWAALHQMRLVQVVRPSFCGWFLVYVGLTVKGASFIALDVSTEYRIKNHLVLTGDQLLRNRIANHDGTTNATWFEPSHPMQCVYYLTKRMSKRDVGARRMSLIRKLYSKDPEQARAELRVVLESRFFDLVIMVLGESSETSDKLDCALKNESALKIGHPPSLRDKMRHAVSTAHRLARPLGEVLMGSKPTDLVKVLIERWGLSHWSAKTLNYAIYKSGAFSVANRVGTDWAAIDQCMINHLGKRAEHMRPWWLYP